MARGYAGKLYILAFDHRGSFEKQFGVAGRWPTPQEVGWIAAAKAAIFDGFCRAVADGIPRDAAGVLVDAQYGHEVARRARAEGYLLAMPVERSGQAEFDFEYGESGFGEKIEEYDPTFSKVLVRYNPDGDRELNERQAARLARLSRWLDEHGRKLLFELLVPAERSQLRALDGDVERYDRELRPALMLRAIEEIQEAGIEPDVWKIEGLEDRDDCRRVAELARRDGREGVVCVVLGRGAPDEKVEAWLRAAAGVPGYVGFALGRSVFGPAVAALAAGSGDHDAAAADVAQRYRRFYEVYEGG